MEQQKLPNVTTAIVLAILSCVCCCAGGIPGIILGGIALYLTKKDENLYRENPEGYSNYGPLKTARILAIIGIALSLIYIVMVIYQIIQAGGWDGYMEQIMEMKEQWGFEE